MVIHYILIFIFSCATQLIAMNYERPYKKARATGSMESIATKRSASLFDQLEDEEELVNVSRRMAKYTRLTDPNEPLFFSELQFEASGQEISWLRPQASSPMLSLQDFIAGGGYVSDEELAQGCILEESFDADQRAIVQDRNEFGAMRADAMISSRFAASYSSLHDLFDCFFTSRGDCLVSIEYLYDEIAAFLRSFDGDYQELFMQKQQGKTIFRRICENDVLQLVELLVSYGANVKELACYLAISPSPLMVQELLYRLSPIDS